MSKKEQFSQLLAEAFRFSGPALVLGTPKLEGEVLSQTYVQVPLKTLNRHGLIAGATGTGKTKTLQVIVEQLSAFGVPCLVMDIKGDLSGLGAAGQSNAAIEERHRLLQMPYTPAASPVELLSLSKDKGVRLRATVTEFGPVLFSKILELNDTQSSVMAVIFKYCDDNTLPLLDLEDMKRVLTYATQEGKDSFEKEYGAISPATVGIILRKVVELEQQGAELFFGENSFGVYDLVRQDEHGKGIISILRVTDIQDRPKLFSTFMLQLLAEIYSSFPEEGDLSKPKLTIFIDEAHLIFNEASKALLNQIETIIKLIRSKGIGVFFVTQSPTDIPEAVLGQLGLKIQHALRAFTAKDRKDIQLTAENYPLSDYYQVDTLLTELGIGECIVAALNEKGIPTPLVHCYLRAPQSRMGILTEAELDQILSTSEIREFYEKSVNKDSAYEILSGKIQKAQSAEVQETIKKQQEEASEEEGSPKEPQGKSTLETVLGSPVARQIGREVGRQLVRGLLGALGVGTSRKSTKSTNWWQ